MNGNELGTALQSGLNPVILIVNNSSYGTIRMHQERHYPHRVSGTAIVNPDYLPLRRPMGFMVSGSRILTILKRHMRVPVTRRTAPLSRS